MKRLLPFLMMALVSAPAFAQSTEMEVIYGSVNGEIRRVIVPDDDSQLGPQLAGQGEGYVIAPKGADATAVVKAKTGIDPPVLTSAVVDNSGNVVGVIAADPTIDHPVVANTSLIAAYPGVAKGQTYDSKTGNFIAPATSDTIKAGTVLSNGTVVPADEIIQTPATVVPKPIVPIKSGPVTVNSLQSVVGQ